MKDTKEADEMVFTLSFQIDTNKITVESHEVDSIKLEMEVKGEEFSIVFNKKQALLIAAVIENYFS